MKKVFLLMILMTLMISQIVSAETNTDSSEIESTFPFGDINWDKKVNASDALEVLKYSAKILPLTYREVAIADINDDATLSSEDALIILMRAAGLIDDIGFNQKDISLPDNRYFIEELDYINEFMENSLIPSEKEPNAYNISDNHSDINQEYGGITQLSVCDVYEGGKPELILIDTEESLNTYIISEENGEVKIDTCKTTLIEDKIYVGNDVELYGIAQSHIVKDDPCEIMKIAYAKYKIEVYEHTIPSNDIKLKKTIEVNHRRYAHVEFDKPSLPHLYRVAIDGRWNSDIKNYDFYGVRENHQIIVSYCTFIGWYPSAGEMSTTYNAVLILEELLKTSK